MARKSSSSYAKKNRADDPSYHKLKADYYPVVRSFELATTSSGDYLVGDAGRLLSKTNRRLMRQGKMYTIKLDLSPTAAPGAYEVYALMDSWVLQKAWQLARSTYLTATAEERAQLGSQTARWEDFRVNTGLTLANQQIAEPRLYENSGAADVYLQGEFDSSKITLETTGAVHTFGLGATTPGLEFGIIVEYDRLAGTESDPVYTTSSGAYSGADEEVNNTQMEDLQTEGNAPPYRQSVFEDGIWVKVATLRNDSPNVSKLSTGFFNAPLGLFYVKPPTTTFTFGGELTFSAQAGEYKGVRAHNMGV